MTAHERDIIREIRPKLDAGARGRLMRIYQNLTTKRRNARKCDCGCGNRLLGGNIRFSSKMCELRYRRQQPLKVTRRQKQILRLRESGASFISIAGKLKLALSTVYLHYYEALRRVNNNGSALPPLLPKEP